MSSSGSKGTRRTLTTVRFLASFFFGLVRARAQLNAVSYSSPCSLDNRDKDQEVGHHWLCGHHDPLHRCVSTISRGLLESSFN